MEGYLIQTILPFILSALIVIIITIIAEKYGTKIGGIVGTLPSTIIIAFVFIALNQGLIFASNSVSVVPAEMGINLLFLFVFAILAYRSAIFGLAGSFIVWILLTSILYFSNLQNIYISILIYAISMVFTLIILEKRVKVKSVGKKKVHYTPTKILLRGILTGFVIMISVLLSNVGEVLSGIFTVFPAILSSTMIITIREHGPDFSAGIAKSMIFGSPSVMSYAVCIHFLYPIYGIVWGSVLSLLVAVFISYIMFRLKHKIL